MSYKDIMIRDYDKWNDKTNSYDHIHQDLTKIPLSKLPIDARLCRAIMEGRSFTNIKSTNSTAIRWEGDYYIVSYRPLYSEDSTMDIAVGEKGRVPFMFRSPFIGDPRCGKIHHYYWDYDSNDTKCTMVDATPRECYSHYYNPAIATRLHDLNIDIEKTKYTFGSVMNENTHRMNKIYANVPALNVFSDLIRPYEIGSYAYEIINASTASSHSHTLAPLLQPAWYFRDGTLALDTQDKTIKL